VSVLTNPLKSSLKRSGLAVRWFLVRRLQFKSILAASDSHLTVDRYLRLIALAVGDSFLLLFSVAFLLGVVFSDLSQFEFSEYTSWDTVHAGFSVISQYPEETLAPSVYNNFIISFYTVPIYSFLFFTFFGLGEEAISDYVRAIAFSRRLSERIGFSSPR
jgi:pheromone a factor receptor